MKKKMFLLVFFIFLVSVFTFSPWSYGAPKEVKVRVSWEPLSGGAAAVAAIAINDKLFEKYAQQLGYKVIPEYLEFPGGPAQNEAMAAGQVDIDMQMSSMPIVSRIFGGLKCTLVGMSGSHISNALMVRPGSPINEVSKISGKTVGLVLGSSSHYLLASIVYYHLGKSIPDAGIKLVGMGVAEAMKMPTGLDVAAIWVPHRFIGPLNGLCELLVDGDGFTGKGHKTPGVRLPEVKQSWAYPEGYNTDRLYLWAADKFLKEYPDVVTAWLLAYWEAQDIIVANRNKAFNLINKWWKTDREVVEHVFDCYAEPAGVRNCPVILEWDVLTAIKTSEFVNHLKLREKPLTWDQLKPLVIGGADVQKKAWEMRGKKPSIDDMIKGFQGKSKRYGEIIVNGGAPSWMWGEIPDWGKRIYKAGPFKIE